MLRQPRLRWPIDPELAERLAGRRVRQVARRAKYLLIELDDGATLIIHLGMSGSLRHLPADTPPDATTMWICCWASTACATATRAALAPSCTAPARLDCIRSW